MIRNVVSFLLLLALAALVQPAGVLAGGRTSGPDVEVSHEEAYRGYFLFKRHPHLARKYPSLARQFGGKLAGRSSGSLSDVVAEAERPTEASFAPAEVTAAVAKATESSAPLGPHTELAASLARID